MFAYPDASRYRLGANYQQLPTNLPLAPVYTPMQRDGAFSFRGNYGPDPNYVRSTLRPLEYKKRSEGSEGHDRWVEGRVEMFSSVMTDEDYVQAKGMWDVFARTEGAQESFVSFIFSFFSSLVDDFEG